MVKKLETYFDFAENDYMHFKFCYNAGLVSNQMGAIAQGICEKYLKHIIEKNVIPGSTDENTEKEKILRTHSLARLLRYVKINIPEFEIDRTKIRMIDGFYFTTRYPGDESININEEDVEDCNAAIEECRKKVLEYMKSRDLLPEAKENGKPKTEAQELPKKPKPKSR